VNARALLRWGDLDDARRRTVSPWLVAVLASAVLTALIAWRIDVDPLGASRAWLAAVVVLMCAVMIGAPARLWWRHDAAIVSRLPIPGEALFTVALVRSIRVTLHAVIVCAPSLVFFPREVALRDGAWLGAFACASGFLVPAAALVGGTLVAIPPAVAMAARKAGMPVPGRRSEMLGAIPGFAMSATVIVGFLCVPWLDGRAQTAIGPGSIVVGAIAIVSIVAGVAALRAAPRLMPNALREVVALDRQQLAHLEIHPPTSLERLFARLLNPRARLVHAKDARLMRRRYPLAFVAGALGTIALWILAAARPDSLVAWATALAGAMSLYAAALARRLTRDPIERPVTISSLPFARADLTRAKRLWYASWLVVYVGLGATPVIVRAPIAAATIASAVALSILLGSRALAAEED